MRTRLPLVLVAAALGLVVWLLREPLLGTLFGSSAGREGLAEHEDPLLEASAREARAGEPGGLTLFPAERTRVEVDPLAAERAAQERAAAEEAAAQAAKVPFGGTLRDAAGLPVGPATILIANAQAHVTLAVGTDGAFQSRVLPGRYDLLITAPGRGALHLEGYVIDGMARLDLDLALAPPSSLTLVLQRGGAGVAGARVTLRLTAWRWVDKAHVHGGVTDGDGRVRIVDLAAGTYELVAAIPQGPQLQHEIAVKQDAELVVTVPDGVELSGTVTDEATRRGVAGAEVQVTTAVDKGPALRCTISTEADGTYRFLVPKGKAQSLSVTAAGYAPWPHGREVNNVLGSLKGLVSGKEPVVRDAALRAGGALTGFVTQKETGLALPGVTLAFRPKRGAVVRATSAEEGRYGVPHLNAGRYEVTVETAGWFPETPLEVDVPAGPSEPVTFHIPLLGSRTLQGSVVLAEGAPVKGARVWITGGGKLLRSARGAGRPLETFSAADGAWALTDVPPQADVVVVRAAVGPLEATPAIVGRQTAPASIRLVLGGTVILSGRVLDQATGEPVARARLRLRPQGAPAGREGVTVTTDAAGAFRVEGIIPGDVEVVARRSDYLEAAPRLLPLSGSNDDVRVELVLDPGLAFAGSVATPQGQAVAAAIIVDGTPAAGGEAVRRSAQSGPDGRFRLTGFAAGTYRLRVLAKGHRTRTLEGLRGGEDALRVVLERDPAPE